MGFADLTRRITESLSLVGQILLILNLPLIMTNRYTFSWITLLVLIFAPTLSALLQLALSRTREFVADMSAVELTKDPRALASALAKIDQFQRILLNTLFWYRRRHNTEASWMRTHPPTKERIRRLMTMDQNQSENLYSYRTYTPYFGRNRSIQWLPNRRVPIHRWI